MVDRYYLPQQWQEGAGAAGRYVWYETPSQADTSAAPAYPAACDRPPAYAPAVHIRQDRGEQWQRKRSAKDKGLPPRMSVGQALSVSFFLLAMATGTVACAYYVLSFFGFH